MWGIIQKLKANWSILIISIITILLNTIGLNERRSLQWFSSIFLYIILSILNIVQHFSSITKKKLKEELDKWRRESSLYLDLRLKSFADEKLKFNQQSWTSRISLYKYYKIQNNLEEEGFHCVSRYSNSLEFSNKSIKKYKKCGILNFCRENGNRNEKWYFDNKIPDPSNRPEYCWYYNRKYGYTDPQLKNLHMKSRLYYAWRVASKDWEPIWILLLESKDKDTFKERTLNKLFNEIQDLEHIIQFLLPNVPIPYNDISKKL